MKNTRRQFLKYAGMTGLSIAGSNISDGFGLQHDPGLEFSNVKISPDLDSMARGKESLSIIGLYGQWAASLTGNKLPSMSFRNKEWSERDKMANSC